MTPANLRNARMSAKLLYSSFPILTGIGYIAALISLYMTHVGLDGKPGIDMRDIVESHYGNAPSEVRRRSARPVPATVRSRA